MTKFDAVQIATLLAHAEAFINDGLYDDGCEFYFMAADGINDLASPQEFLAATIHAERVLREVILPAMGRLSRKFEIQETH